ncbi:hypothetical protein EELLY_v1c01160 [Entomoplasma ellychniae]|uniref:PD-(D/E)XK endonuclease-like domain-containing protein n=1 Tax=Entomoplasma ellychniae TaxID=2114 RepID=A0A8E2UAE2_9MOLU|nr:hypothetical protein [Entomoplasma ellychniae]PPE04441.1 hypothetical protein EELLY_v1c01160 [Entomoplasma ellychniae]
MEKIENILRQEIFIDEESHKYYLKGVEINRPSVSAIMQYLPQYVFDDSFAETQEGKEILVNAITRGLHLHKIAEVWLKDRQERTCCNLYGHLEMKRWLLKILQKITNDYNEEDGWEIISELSMVGERYVGTLDILLINNKTKQYLIGDIKTTRHPDLQKETLQLTLYKHLLEERFNEININDMKLNNYFVINCNKINKEVYFMSENIQKIAEKHTLEIFEILKSKK